MGDHYNSFDVNFKNPTKSMDEVIPLIEDDESSVGSSLESLASKGAKSVKGFFNGFMGASSSDEEESISGECEKKEDEEEEEEKSFLESLKDSAANAFDKNGLVILLLTLFIGFLIYLYLSGNLTNLVRMIPVHYLTGEGHDHHHGHAGCTCKNKGAHHAVGNATANTGECPCQRAKRLAEEAAKAAEAAAEAVEDVHDH
ncbi:hypothetical protein, conserved [Plasmodium gonderi]|uniref:Uncharacterized protein n=1 Tax=Plasmodium gonderi TaxID=77519 RepID=A0A1Y1JH41_PLAGO|nr:hypothetical protein, conserved [Plasmodium gonderi]GAW81560.1 hypothetical protein, conserved [Plasmodium gonderi]